MPFQAVSVAVNIGLSVTILPYVSCSCSPQIPYLSKSSEVAIAEFATFCSSQTTLLAYSKTDNGYCNGETP